MNAPVVEMDEQARKDVANSWHVLPRHETKRGWLVFSLEYVVAALQGCGSEPQEAKHTVVWRIVGGLVLGVMAVGQVVIMILAVIPVVSTLVEILARSFTASAPGFFLRACYWKAKLKRLGQDTIIDPYVDIRGPASVVVGSHCHLDAYVRLKGGERSYGQHGSIEIGNYVHLGPGVLIVGRGGVVIEDYVSLSADARVYSATNTIEYAADPGRLISMSHVAPRDRQQIVEKPIVIEEYAFVGLMTTILPGVRIGRAAVVHANLELSRDVPAFSNIGGLPRGRHIGWRRPRRVSPQLGTPCDEGGDARSRQGGDVCD